MNFVKSLFQKFSFFSIFLCQLQKTRTSSNIHSREIITGSLISFCLKISGMILGYVVILIIANRYGSEGLGTYNLILSLIIIIATISVLGLNQSIPRFAGQFNTDLNLKKQLKLLHRYILEVSISVSLLLAVGIFLLAENIAIHFFHNKTYLPALQAASIAIPFQAILLVSVELLRGLKHIKLSEYLRTVNRPVVNLLLLSVSGFIFSGILLPVYTLCAAIVITATIGLFSTFSMTGALPPCPETNFSRKELLRTSFPMFVSILFSMVLEHISIFSLEYYHTTSDVGLFSVAYKLSILVSMPLLITNSISAPKFAELYWQKQKKNLQHAIDISAKIVFFFSCSIAIFIFLFSEHILKLFGHEFISTHKVLIILIFSQLINAVTGSVGAYLNMSGNQTIYRNIIMLSVTISLLLHIFLVPEYGIQGAMYSYATGVILSNLISVVYVRVKFKIKTYYNPFYSLLKFLF